jgi:hypothetical protein
MASRHTLPVAPPEAVPRTVESVRDRLGGRAESLPGVGAIVSIRSSEAEPKPGVVLFASDERFDIWFGGGTVRRVLREQIEPFLGDPPAEIMVVASDARIFAELKEGQTVRFSPTSSGDSEGTLAEKCRFGGLVRRSDGVLVGVGFQRLWPAAEPLVN